MEDIKDEMGSWDKEDDKYLRTLLSIHGNHNWTTIASSMNATFPTKRRTAQECKERWYTYLDPAVSKQPWTDQEELEMLIAHQKHQNKWSDVAQALKGRSNNTIKNRFYSIFRKVKNKIKRRDFTYATKLELLEIFYMISLMEHYFAHPPPIPEQKGKRGKDFIYSLLRTLRVEDVIKYKSDLQKLGGKETTLEELWLEMANQGSSSSKPADAGPMDTGEKPIDLFSYINEPPTYERSRYVLPPPHDLPKPEPLTPDEKDFIQSQAFQNREPCSAGAYLSQPMSIMSPPTYRSAAFSAGRPKMAPGMSRYEAFSDFTDMAYKPPQSSSYGNMQPMYMSSAMSPPVAGRMPQIRLPMQIFRPPPF